MQSPWRSREWRPHCWVTLQRLLPNKETISIQEMKPCTFWDEKILTWVHLCSCITRLTTKELCKAYHYHSGQAGVGYTDGWSDTYLSDLPSAVLREPKSKSTACLISTWKWNMIHNCNSFLESGTFSENIFLLIKYTNFTLKIIWTSATKPVPCYYMEHQTVK